MDKKILAIAAVFCLDLVFILMTGGMFRSEDPIAAAHSPNLQPITAENIDNQKADSNSKASEEATNLVPDRKSTDFDRLNRGTSSTTGSLIKPARKSTRKRPAFQANVHDQSGDQFVDTVILVKHRRDDQNDADHALSVDHPKSRSDTNGKSVKKRSVFSRTVTVVKKPYEWTKSLISKL